MPLDRQDLVVCMLYMRTQKLLTCLGYKVFSALFDVILMDNVNFQGHIYYLAVKWEQHKRTLTSSSSLLLVDLS